VPFLRKNRPVNGREKVAVSLELEPRKNPEMRFADRIGLPVLPNQMRLQARNNIWSHGFTLESGGIRTASGVPQKAVESLREDERQRRPEKPPSTVSANNKRKPRKNRNG
jgi:hypothetical protein